MLIGPGVSRLSPRFDSRANDAIRHDLAFGFSPMVVNSSPHKTTAGPPSSKSPSILQHPMTFRFRGAAALYSLERIYLVSLAHRILSFY